MRIVTWNIRQGGAASRYQAMADRLDSYDADMLVFTEFQEKSHQGLAPLLRDKGYPHEAYSGATGRTNGVFVMAKAPFIARGTGIATDAPERALSITLSESRLSFLCVHIPGSDDKKFSKVDFWNSILSCCRQKDNAPDVIIGDFNTGLTADSQGTTFSCMEQMQSLLAGGWQDAWRKLHGNRPEFTWYSNAGNGFRLDHCLVRDSLAPAIRHAYYSHQERETKLSDHSLLVVELMN